VSEMFGRILKYFLMILTLAATGSLCAQEVNVKSGFVQDSLSIGDKSPYYLTARYPSNLNIIFPDSTYNFAPFEYQYKVYFPTKTINGQSYDSVVYYLSTFEIDKQQSLSLPVYQINSLDSLTFFTNRDTILLSEYVKQLPDSLTAQNLPLKVNTAYQNVSYLFNYPVLLIVAGAILFLALLGWLIFGRRIRTYYRLKKMRKMHEKFLETYSSQVEKIRQAFSTSTTEAALLQWKKYMEYLESRPYTKLTSRETTRMENNETLGKNLHTIDGAIYGHATSVLEPLENLKNFAQQRFSKKMEEVKHGRR
jgi:hypothetical protein